MTASMQIKEMSWPEPRFLLLAILTSLLLVGCVSSKPNVAERASLDTLIKQADTELAIGKSEQSIAILNQAARENPTSMVPWLRMSNIWFNSGNYPSAILTANEVLHRESENQEAKSILVVAGLRVAAGAITGLVPQNPVNPGARAEAENLTKALRAALGEKVLVPAPESEAKSTPSVTHQRKHRIAKAGDEAAPASIPTATRSSPEGNIRSATATASFNSSGSSGSDPFKSLK